MKIKYHKTFLKNYRKRIHPNRKSDSQFEKRLKLFFQDPHHPLLNGHRLRGEKREYRAFSISGNIRVVYKKENNTIQLFDVGTHNQVY